MQYYNFSMYKDHDQMKEKRVHNPFGLNLNYKPLLTDRNLRVFVEVWKEPTDIRRIQLFRDATYPDKTCYQVRIPFDEIEETIYIFRIFIIDEANKVVEESGNNVIRPISEDIPPDTDEEFENLGGYDYVQGILNMIAVMQNDTLEVLNKAAAIKEDVSNIIEEWVAQVNVNAYVYDIIDQRIYYKGEQLKQQLLESLTDYINENVSRPLEATLKRYCNELLAENMNLLEQSNAQQLADTLTRVWDYNKEQQQTIREELRDTINEDVDEKLAETLTTLDNILGLLVSDDDGK